MTRNEQLEAELRAVDIQGSRRRLMRREDALLSEYRRAGVWPKGNFCVVALRAEYLRWRNPDAPWAERRAV